MQRADLNALLIAVRDIVEASSLAPRVRDVRLEESDDDKADFLRVMLKVQAADDLDWEEIRDLVRAIEDAVADMDERFPSVRFAEAA